jgi:hypothetical protein
VIVGSLLLILAAVASLVVGLVRGSNALLICSIAASLLAAIVLIVGARRSAARRAAAGRAPGAVGGIGLDDTLAGQVDVPTMRNRPDTPLRKATAKGPGPGTRAGAFGDRGATEGMAAEGGGTMVDDAPTQVFIPSQSRQGMAPDGDRDGLDDGYDDEDPADEPAAQVVSPQDAARVAQMSTEVLVIDGRPRYHHPSCVHLLGRENEPLPVGEAVELGFTPCGLCEPDSAMLAEARRA